MSRPVTVLLFAAAREAYGKGRIEVPHHDGLTAAAIWERMVRERPALEAFSQTVSVARNQRFTPRDTAVEPGDELAFLPPVSGG